MTSRGWFEIGAFVLVLLALVRPVGRYLWQVFERERPPGVRMLGWLERALLRAGGVAVARGQSAREYGGAVLAFGFVGVLVTHALLRLQSLLPPDPGHAAVAPLLAFDTAVSFTTNTNWQAYAGESTMSYGAQMLALTWQNFVSAATGFGVMLAFARGLTRRGGDDDGVGNFWVDLVRALVYVLLPLALAFALVLASQGVIQTFAAPAELATLESGTQTVALGPVASQEAIKLLGVNGGGFFNANSAHPFENPTPLSDFVQCVAILLLPAALTHTYGCMTGNPRQGWVLLGAMTLLMLAGVAAVYAAEAAGNPAAALPGVAPGPNLEGKEVRFGLAGSALFATITTDASCGAVNGMHDSFTPLGGLVLLLDIMLGEVVFGGIGVGLVGMLVLALLAVFVAGLMVGRTPEYLGKKVEAREMKLAMLYVLTVPLVLLVLAAAAAVGPWGTASLGNAGPHGLSEILYAYASASGNNGSAFAGLAADTPFYNLTLAVAMLVGRFALVVPVLGIAASMRRKTPIPPGPGTLPTDGGSFLGLLIAVVLVVGALTFFPVLCLGPIVEHFTAAAGRFF